MSEVTSPTPATPNRALQRTGSAAFRLSPSLEPLGRSRFSKKLRWPIVKVTLLLIANCFIFTACKRTPVAQQPTPQPFHPTVRFRAYDGAPPNFNEMTFQVTANGRSEFLKLGNTIPKTTIRLSDFDPATQQLIVTDTATNQRARLTLPKPVDSPATF